MELQLEQELATQKARGVSPTLNQVKALDVFRRARRELCHRGLAWDKATAMVDSMGLDEARELAESCFRGRGGDSAAMRTPRPMTPLERDYLAGRVGRLYSQPRYRALVQRRALQALCHPVARESRSSRRVRPRAAAGRGSRDGPRLGDDGGEDEPPQDRRLPRLLAGLAVALRWRG
jgi:hypothetical protein